MTNTFLNKVAAERIVLSIVNARTRGARQLTGLSSAAIQSWSQRLGAVNSNAITGNLLVLAELCQCLSDRSHETFQPLDPSLEHKIKVRIDILQKAVNDLP